MVFPQMQIDMFPRLERFDVQFDIPDVSAGVSGGRFLKTGRSWWDVAR
jgi:hypothetical protein